MFVTLMFISKRNITYLKMMTAPRVNAVLN